MVGKYGGQAITHVADPPSPRHWNDPLERQAPIHMASVPLQELPERCCIQPRTAFGIPTPDFSSGLATEAFPVGGWVWPQGSGGLKSEFSFSLQYNSLIYYT